MKILCLFGTDPNDDLAPELMTAWDEYCVEENHDGFEKAVKKAKAERSDLSETRIVEIEVDERALRALFRPTSLKGVVLPSEE